MNFINQIFQNKKSKATQGHFPSDVSDEEKEIIELVKPYTMTSTERLIALVRAIDYVEKRGIGGDIVECGVWKGGSMMAIAKRLLQLNKQDRNLYLYDTFSGMTAPGDEDKDFLGRSAEQLLAEQSKNKESHIWAFSPKEEVTKNVLSVGYNSSKIFFIEGKVEATIPNSAHHSIAILRLDTDWFSSTYHELVHLFPLLSKGGVLIIDDYGYWKGAKEAVDRYFAENGIGSYFHRIDDTGRLLIKE